MPTSYVSSSNLSRILTIPVSLPQTELLGGKSIEISQIQLGLGQSFELRSLTLHLLQVLTPGVSPLFNTTSLGLASVGVYLTSMLTGSPALVQTATPGAVSYNPNAPAKFSSPGLYTFVASNNTSNLGLSIIVTGSVKLFS